jgi:hypothetical protein
VKLQCTAQEHCFFFLNHLPVLLPPILPSTALLQTVLDWLCDNKASGSFSVDPAQGHRLLAQACFSYIKQDAQVPASPLPGKAAREAEAEGAALTGGEGKSAACNSTGHAVLAYALRHAVCHLCKAGELGMLEKLLTDFVGLWSRAFAAGESDVFGPLPLSMFA